MYNEKEYQEAELRRFINQKACYYDTVNDFDEWLQNTDIKEQIEWIANGSYGAGACFMLQSVWNRIKDNNRVNKNAQIGGVVLKCFYGREFRYWNKLSKKVQDKMNKAVTKWIKGKKEFAQTLISEVYN